MAERIGDPSVFAIEFEISDFKARMWNEHWGRLWLWVGGGIVGNLDEFEMIQTGLDSLLATAREERDRASEALQGLSAEDALNAVMNAGYGEEESRDAHSLSVSEGCLAAVEVLPRLTAYFFDGWEAILLECGVSKRFVYRHEGKETFEVLLPTGAFAQVVGEACAAFERLARAKLNQ
jgi:hypothetical protein